MPRLSCMLSHSMIFPLSTELVISSEWTDQTWECTMALDNSTPMYTSRVHGHCSRLTSKLQLVLMPLMHHLLSLVKNAVKTKKMMKSSTLWRNGSPLFSHKIVLETPTLLLLRLLQNNPNNLMSVLKFSKCLSSMHIPTSSSLEMALVKSSTLWP